MRSTNLGRYLIFFLIKFPFECRQNHVWGPIFDLSYDHIHKCDILDSPHPHLTLSIPHYMPTISHYMPTIPIISCYTLIVSHYMPTISHYMPTIPIISHYTLIVSHYICPLFPLFSHYMPAIAEKTNSIDQPRPP